MQTVAASLVAAIPAGIVLAFGVMVLLNYSENVMKSMVLAGTLVATLLLSTVLMLMPFGLAIFGGRKPAAGAEAGGTSAASPDKDQAPPDDADGDLQVSDGEVMVDEGEEVAETVDFDSGSLQTEIGTFDEEDVDVFEEEEEPPPPGKKKKR